MPSETSVMLGPRSIPKAVEPVMDAQSSLTSGTVRLRRYHSRNRTGCLTCRRRHVRCDESRPSCSNCLVGKRACDYPSIQPTLRERRSNKKSLPGQQQPWAVNEAPGLPSLSVALLTPNTSVDPFDTLAVRMPLKSQELFYYFTRGNDRSKVAKKQAACLGAVVHDPYALRSTLILAGLHYSWRMGQLRGYEPTFLFHKVESIRTVNDWVRKQDAAGAAVAVRQVVTLGFAECCLDNFPAAKVHLSGLLALLDRADPHGSGQLSADEVDNELAERYFILSQTFLRGLKTGRNREKLRTESSSREVLSDCQVPETPFWMGRACLEDAGDLETRLQCLAMFPHFLAPPPRGREPTDIDAYPVIRILRDMTGYADRRMTGWDDPEGFFIRSSTTKLFNKVVDLHIASFTGTEEEPPRNGMETPVLTTSWTGMCGAMELYLHSVLGIWNARRPMPSRLLCRIARILRRHLIRDRERSDGNGAPHRGFWFWKAFVSVIALARRRVAAGNASSSSPATPSPGSTSTFTPSSSSSANLGGSDLEGLEKWFMHAARDWARTANIRTWEEAKAVLAEVVWPVDKSSEPIAVSLWRGVMQARD